MNDNKLRTIVCKSLDKDVDAISGSVQSKLTRARARALQGMLVQPKVYFSFVPLNYPMKVAAVIASITFVAVVAFSALNINEYQPIEIAEETLTPNELMANEVVNEDVGKEFFLTEEDLDFFENLELYQWLDSEFKIS